MYEKDLWPDFEDVPKISSPKSILIEQINFLEEKTKNILSGNIRTGNTNNGRIYNTLSIVAPLLKNYSYTLLSIVHDAIYYPCDITHDSKTFMVQDEDELLQRLKDIFSSENTKKVITSLLGQSKEVSDF